jgi:hypothetical protein
VSFKKLIFTLCAILKCLVEKTKRCISRRNAKNTSEESVIFLLSLKNLAIDSEKELVDFCATWAKGKKPNGRYVFIFYRMKVENANV